MSQVIGPMSCRETYVDNLNVLQRTASMDHYLSNGTTFLKGQRFISPSSRKSTDGLVKK